MLMNKVAAVMHVAPESQGVQAFAPAEDAGSWDWGTLADE